MAIRLSIYYLNIKDIAYVNNYIYYSAGNILPIEYTCIFLCILLLYIYL